MNFHAVQQGYAAEVVFARIKLGHSEITRLRADMPITVHWVRLLGSATLAHKV